MSDDLVERGAGNVFVELGLPEADLHRAKADLAFAISDVIARRRLTRIAAREAMAITKTELADLLRGRIRWLSLERLEDYLIRLGMEITIVVAPAPKGKRPTRIVKYRYD